MKHKKISLTTLIINGLLLGGLLLLIIIFLLVVSDLPERVYTSAQREYLEYNDKRSIYQLAPTWNAIMPVGAEAGEVEVVPFQLEDWKSLVRAELDAHYEEQEGVSISMYELVFQSEYEFSYSGPAPTTTVQLVFPFPSNLETLHDVSFKVDDEEPENVRYALSGISWDTTLQTGEKHRLSIGYRASGANRFSYSLNQDRRSDIDIVFTVRGLPGSQIPRHALQTSDVKSDSAAEVFTWNYRGLIPNRDIQINLPERLSFAQRIARLQERFRTLAGLSPLLIGAFLLSLLGLFRLGGVSMKFEVYLLLGLCLALFYPILTFLSGLLGLLAGSIIALFAAIALILVFLGFSIGWRATTFRAGWLLVIFLGIFSLGLFTPWSGLAYALGGLCLVGTFMAAYVLKPKAQISELAIEEVKEIAEENVPIEEPSKMKEKAIESEDFSKEVHCPHCGHKLETDHNYCPNCGYEVQFLWECDNCGATQLVQAGDEKQYCLRCGAILSKRRNPE